MTIDFASLYETPTQDHIKQLEESFKQFGIRDAVVKSHDGVIISGHLRTEIGTRLNIHFREEILPASTTEAQMLSEAVLANKERRPRDPKDTAKRLREECGWSYQRIGENLGEPESTVRRWVSAGPPNGGPDGSIDNDESETEPQSAPPPRSTGKDNKSYPAQKATKAEVVRRQKFALQLWNQGHGLMAIEKALGIHRTTIKTDLALAGADLDAPRMRGLAPPTPLEWRDSPKPPKAPRRTKNATTPQAPPPSPAYQTSDVVRHILRFQVFLEGFEEDNYGGMLAHNVEEARLYTDVAWEADLVRRLTAAQQAVTDLLRVMQDEDYRQYRMKGRDHDDPNHGRRRVLRAVKDAG